MTKVLSCLKILLTSMCVDRFAGCEVPDLVNSFPPLPSPPNWSLNSLEEIIQQPVLKSFTTVFIQNNEGLENKLTRAPLLGLAKSIY